eukprot:TRINITY_DN69241_c0_g1_i1.p1 TRINITY_DN69241_c0_g1~~TRINITY_DN69241_c0_g1_i1.p1  ORF type:complete len:171 (+),score=34.66 TRINITY_DN69241_c0_g1_i1:2-514(+)
MISYCARLNLLQLDPPSSSLFDAAGAMASAAAKTIDRRMITHEELAKHNSEEDCWLAVHGLVLELPKTFLDEHPGGPDSILVVGGTDATSEFEDTGHTNSARKWASDHIIGYLEGAPTACKTREALPTAQEILAARHKKGGASKLAKASWGCSVLAVVAAVGVAHLYFMG